MIRCKFQLNLYLNFLNSLQAQFVIALHVLFGTLFLVDRVSCADKKPAFTIVLGIVQCLYFIYIFGSFYVKTYVKSKLN